MLRYIIERKDPEWTKFLDLNIAGMCTQIVLGHAESRLRAIHLMVIYGGNVALFMCEICNPQFRYSALHESYDESAHNKFSYRTHLPMSVDDLYLYFDEVCVAKC